MTTKVFSPHDLELLLHKLDSLIHKNQDIRTNHQQANNIPTLTEVIKPEQELQQLLQQTKQEIEQYVTQNVKQQLEKMIDRQLDKQFDLIKSNIINSLKPQIDEILPLLIQKELNKIKLF